MQALPRVAKICPRMEAASRPPLELLPDLPVEEPLDPARRTAPLAAPPVLPAASASGADPKDPVQTSIQFLDPAALLLATAEVPALSTPPRADPAPAAPAATPANAAPKSEARAFPAPAPELELLEDPAVVEELLTTPPPPPPVPRPLPASPAPTHPVGAAGLQGAAAAAKESAPRVEARVPIAKTASLSSAAHKLAAAGRRSEKAAPALAPAPPRPAAPAPAPAAAKPKAAAPRRPRISPAGPAPAPPRRRRRRKPRARPRPRR